MKKKFTHFSKRVKSLACLQAMVIFGALIFTTPAFSQSAPTPDYAYLSTISWKTAVELDNTLTQEIVKADISLNQANLQAADRAIYGSYKRLLSYILADAQSGMPLSDAIVKNLEKVQLEYPKDPALAAMPEGYLETMIPGLVEVLTAPQVPIPVSAH